MSKSSTQTSKSPVAVLVISPEGHFYEQSSLMQCATFLSDLHARLTGGVPMFMDHSAVRAKLAFEGGEFLGVLAGWRIMEFPDYSQMRRYMWDQNGVPQVNASTNPAALKESRNKGSIEREKDRKIERKNDRITEQRNHRTNPESTVISGQKQNEFSLTSSSNGSVSSVLDEFDRIFGDVV